MTALAHSCNRCGVPDCDGSCPRALGIVGLAMIVVKTGGG